MPNGIELAKAYVQIIPSADGISEGIKKSLGPEMEEAGESSSSGFAKRFLGGAASAITAGAAVVGAAAGAVWSAASDVAAVGDEIDKTSQKIGVSAEQYQAMAFAAEHSGFAVSTFQTAAKNLANTDFSGSVWDAVESIQAIEDPAERAAAAEELLGAKAAQEMAAFFNSNETLTDYRDNLADLGGIMSDSSVKASADFQDSLADLQVSFKGLSNGMVAEFLPNMTTVMEGFTGLITGEEGAVEKIKEGISGFLTQLGEMMPTMIDTAGDLISAFLDVVIDNLPQIISMGMELIVKLGVGIIKAIPDLLKQVPAIIKAVVDGITDGLAQIVAVGGQIVSGIWDGIKGAASQFKENVKGFFKGVIDDVKDTLGIHSPSRVFADSVGQWIPAGIAEGIEDNSDLVTDALDDITSDVSAGVDLSVNPSGSALSGFSVSSESTVNAILSIGSAIVSAVNNKDSNVYMDSSIVSRTIYKAMENEGTRRGNGLVVGV